ncbi:MAG TPA: exodeoxyribonuclease VII large subunit [Vicinamibacterales bacterium]|nr:exodeoxyribonuclease VII large subunit [Vicinamibacterales bacterium]HOQ59237.1 exodeoxyribonuclease VII large subunit [Vicinamibacterales bacterium]HPK70746.1 exodeoxyribonuclease VII large subunit [Vicinamibacterales bacterium]
MPDLFDFLPESGGADGAPPRDQGPRIYTVGEITAAIRTVLETTWADVWIEGELSNCRLWNTGHLYFSLKDPSAQLRGVMFKREARSLAFRPEDGLHVLVRGRLGVYEPKGEYQIVCSVMEPRGLGARQLALDQLKRRLQAEGLLDAARKRPLPALPRKIGVVTSMDGAALRDVLTVLGRRYPDAHVVIAPARVQGEGAAADLARALGAIGRVDGVDVVIVGRGGGAVEDLWAFNEEPVARAVAQCPVPVVSAVGHEVDVTLADLVADLRAPTPSAAAELVVAAKDEVVRRIDHLADRLDAACGRRVRLAAHALDRLTGRPAFAGFAARLALRGRHVAELLLDLQRAGRDRIAARQRGFQALRLRLEALDLRRSLGRLQARLAQGHARLASAFAAHRHAADARLGALTARLDALSPLAVLGRGYAVCWDGARRLILRDASAVADGTAVRVTLHRGELSCVVTGRDVPEPAPHTARARVQDGP